MPVDLEKIEELEKKLQKINRESLPFGLFIAGIGLGVVSSVMASFMYDKFGQNDYFILVVEIIFAFFCVLIYMLHRKAYGQPMKKLEKEIEQLKKQN